MKIDAGVVRVLNSDDPGRAVWVFGTGNADIAAQTDEQACGGGLGDLLGSPAFGNGAYINGHLRVSNEYGGGIYR